jgi:hypothetical protein
VTRSVLEKTGDEDRPKRTCDNVGYKQDVIRDEAYLSSNISNRWSCDSSHPVDACIAGPGGFGILFDGARRREDMLVCLTK